MLRVLRVLQPAAVDSAKRQAERQQINAALAQQETFAYIEALKQKAKVKILKPVDAKSGAVE